MVNADASRLKQPIWNVLGNAVKFTPKGGNILVQLRAVDSSAEIVVTDSGEGLDPQFIPSLFNRFTQSDSSTTRAHGGLGLGLAIVKHVVEAHGGSVTAESEGKGRGATFRIRIPISPIKWRLDNVQERPTLPRVSIDGVSVLVVEDDADSRDFIAAALKGAGARVQSAGSAAEALELLTDKINVLVSDIGMPYEDGYALIRKVRQQGNGIPAIALTAFAKPEDRVAAISAGYQAHVSKPLDPGELTRIIAALLNRNT